MKVRVYVDGFNIYHAIDALKKPHLKWLNQWKLAQSLLRKGEKLDEVHFFTAVLRWNSDKQKRHVNYINALKSYGVTVHEANFKKMKKVCRAQNRRCDFHEEKQTDVAIAVKMVSDALSGCVHRSILMTADSDQIPTVKFIQSLKGPKLTLIYPPGRQQEARDLGNQIPDRKELSEGHIGTCLLPRSVQDPFGKTVATCPALYQKKV